jgi:hypothetical protein
MAFKIVYGAGQNLNVREGSGFGAGYGFLEMHQNDEVKNFALEKLERRLVGNSFGFERGEQWSEGETITISSFQKVDDWYVLLKVRPVTESRGRVYFLAEFLLIDSTEAELLADLNIVPAAILEASHTDLWFAGELWDKPARWLTKPIDLVEMAREGSFASLSETDTHRAWLSLVATGRVWRADRGTPEAGWHPADMLAAMRASQERFLNEYHDRFPFPKACFELTWQRCSLTSFYLDASSGLDLQIGQSYDGLPYDWTGVFTGIPMHQEIIGWAEERNLLVELGEENERTDDFGDATELVQNGWIMPVSGPAEELEEIPVPMSPSSHQPINRREQRITAQLPKFAKARSGASERASSQKKTKLQPKWLALGALGIAALVGIPLVMVKLKEQSQASELLKALSDHAKDAQEHGGGIVSFVNRIEDLNKPIEKTDATETKSEKKVFQKLEEFRKYREFLRAYSTLQAHLQGYPEMIEDADKPVPAPGPVVESSENLALVPKIKALWDIIMQIDRQVASVPNAKSELDALFAVYSNLRDASQNSNNAEAVSIWTEHRATAANAELNDQWANYERAILHNLNLKLNAVLTQAELSANTATGNHKELREKDPKDHEIILDEINLLVRRISEINEMQLFGEDPTTHSTYYSRATELAGKLAASSSKDSPSDIPSSQLPRPEDGSALGLSNLITRASFMARTGDAYDFPWQQLRQQEAGWELYSAGPDILKAAMSKARWVNGKINIPIPELAGITKLKRLIVSKDSIKTGTDRIAKVKAASLEFDISDKGTNETTQTEQVTLLIAVNQEKKAGECWIYIPMAPGSHEKLTAEIDISKFLSLPKQADENAILIENTEQIHLTIRASEKTNLGEVVISPATNGDILRDKKTLGAFVYAGSDLIKAGEFKLRRGAGLIESAKTFQYWFLGTQEDPATPSRRIFVDFRIPPGMEDLKQSIRNVMETQAALHMLKDSAVTTPSLEHCITDYFQGAFVFIGNSFSNLQPGPILPSDDPLFGLASQLKKGISGLTDIENILMGAQKTYNPDSVRPPKKGKQSSGDPKKPDPPEKKQTKEEQDLSDRLNFQADNGVTMKANWKRFQDDLPNIRNFVESFDQLEPKRQATKENVQSYLNILLVEVPKRQLALDTFKKTLESGNLEGIQFHLVLTPK